MCKIRLGKVILRLSKDVKTPTQRQPYPTSTLIEVGFDTKMTLPANPTHPCHSNKPKVSPQPSGTSDKYLLTINKYNGIINNK